MQRPSVPCRNDTADRPSAPTSPVQITKPNNSVLSLLKWKALFFPMDDRLLMDKGMGRESQRSEERPGEEAEEEGGEFGKEKGGEGQ